MRVRLLARVFRSEAARLGRAAGRRLGFRTPLALEPVKPASLVLVAVVPGRLFAASVVPLEAHLFHSRIPPRMTNPGLLIARVRLRALLNLRACLRKLILFLAMIVIASVS